MPEDDSIILGELLSRKGIFEIIHTGNGQLAVKLGHLILWLTNLRSLCPEICQALFVQYSGALTLQAMAGEAAKDKGKATEDTGSYWEYDDQFEDFEGTISFFLYKVPYV